MNKRLIGVWSVFSLLLLATGCPLFSGSSTDGPIAANRQGPTAFEADQAKEDLLPVAGEVAHTVIKGVLSIGGLSILDADETVLPDSKFNIGLLVRVVDPGGDDILSAVVPGAGGFYELTVFGELSAVRWELEAQVAEDLDGDGEGGDRIVQSVPLSLSPGRVVSMDMALELPSLVPQGPNQPMPIPDVPEKGEVLLVSYDRQDAAGPHEEEYAIYFEDMLVVYDENNDGVFDPEHDLGAVDDDLNGWGDPYQESFAGGYQPPPPGVEPDLGVQVPDQELLPSMFPLVEGWVESVDLEARTITITISSADVPDAGQSYTVQLTPYTVVSVVEAGFTNEDVPLSAGMVGNLAVMEVFWSPAGLEALWVVFDRTAPR